MRCNAALYSILPAAEIATGKGLDDDVVTTCARLVRVILVKVTPSPG
jgi:hypothetical protein